MKKLIVAAALGVLAATTFAGATTPVTGIARFREQQTSFSSFGDFQGAPEVWRTTVLLLGRPKTVGYGSITCSHVTRTIRVCTGVYTLPRGQIAVAGELAMRTSFQLLIVGGSGAYAHAGGTLSAVGTTETRVISFNFGT